MHRLLRFALKEFFYNGTKGQIRMFGTTYGVLKEDDSDVFGNWDAIKVKKKSNLLEVAEKNVKNAKPKVFADSGSKKILQKEKNDDDAAETVKGDLTKLYKEIAQNYDKQGRPLRFECKKKSFQNKKDFSSTEIIDGELQTVPELDSEFMTPFIKLHSRAYGSIIRNLCRENRLKDAIRVFDEVMPMSRVKPTVFCYNNIIQGCGKAGYTSKAMDLFLELRDRGLVPEPMTLTSVFNACANCPWPEQGLKAAKMTRKIIEDNCLIMTQITYHSMIKAYGHGGDIQGAFEIVDKMFEEGHTINIETISFLLQACITDKEAGFRHAIAVWKKMRALKILPNNYTYQLLLRCVLECKAGDESRLRDMLAEDKKAHLTGAPSKRAIKPPPKIQEKKANMSYPALEDPDGVVVMEVLPKQEVKSSKLSELPDVLSPQFVPPENIEVQSLEWPQDRLAFLGDSSTVLKNMKKDGVQPNIVMFTYIIQCSIHTKKILKLMDACNVKPDDQFCIVLMRKVAGRPHSSYEKCQEVLDYMSHHDLAPSLAIYGCLALACSTAKQCRKFIQELDKAEILPNVQIFTALVVRASLLKDFGLLFHLLKKSRKYQIEFDTRCLKILETLRVDARNYIVQYEQNGEGTKLEVERRMRYLAEYRHTLNILKYQRPDHPWEQHGYKLAEEKNYELRKLGVQTVAVK